MFTQEEKDFIDRNPEFVELLKSLSDDELSAFTEILTIVCELTPEERTAFYKKVDDELKKLERPSRIEFAQMVSRRFENGIDDLSYIDDWKWLDKCYKRYLKGDLSVLDEIRAAVAEAKMTKAVNK